MPSVVCLNMNSMNSGNFRCCDRVPPARGRPTSLASIVRSRCVPTSVTRGSKTSTHLGAGRRRIPLIRLAPRTWFPSAVTRSRAMRCSREHPRRSLSRIGRWSRRRWNWKKKVYPSSGRFLWITVQRSPVDFLFCGWINLCFWTNLSECCWFCMFGIKSKACAVSWGSWTSKVDCEITFHSTLLQKSRLACSVFGSNVVFKTTWFGRHFMLYLHSYLGK